MGDRYSQTCHPCSLPCHLRAGTLLSWKNFETHSSWCLGGNVPSPTLVTPAEAGAQGIKRDLSITQNCAAAIFRMWLWAPASAGVTRVGAWIITLGACCSTHNYAKEDNKKVNNRQTDEQGFSLIEISLALLLIGMLISAVLKSAPLIEAVQLRAVVKNVDSYRMATQLFVEKYGHLPGDYPKASQTLGPLAQNGNGNGRVEGAGLDPHGEAFCFWQHLSSAGLIPHPGTLTPGETPAFGHGLPKARIGGGFTVVDNPPSVPAMPGLWILLGEQNGILNNHASLTPSQARQILDLCGEADPLHGSLRVMEGMDAPPQSCLHHGQLNLAQQAATCIVYFKV